MADQLEKALKNTELKNLLSNTIGGVLSNQIQSMEDEFPFFKSTDEPYNTISLDIKNKINIMEALDLYIKEEYLDGDNKYYCDKY